LATRHWRNPDGPPGGFNLHAILQQLTLCRGVK
jgi:hypothetical protein